ncbi:MAG: NADH-quinone oxidoreductase subunit L [Clostridia bacterium]|nr:NADH-quinone oxidoreductase subunit L [Clostridia bacterium]
MEFYLLALAILLPVLSAVLCFVVPKPMFRNVVVVISTVVMIFVAGMFIKVLMDHNGRIEIDFSHIFPSIDLGLYIDLVIKVLDFFLFAFLLYIGIKLKKPLIVILTLLQLIPLLWFEIFGDLKEPHTAFVIDYLSLVMILLISIIGPIITLFAVGYMKDHEHHLHLVKSRQPRFFMILFAFLGAMNGLVMANNLLWMYFFWEVTTLCSFLLISHDGNEQSVKNAVRALWINLMGGVAFIFGIIVFYKAFGTLSIDDVFTGKAVILENTFSLFPIAIGLLCFAAFTKSAQFPFQSWLLGAMVAPTPVSALLHSSTMVKAGVFLVVRLSPFLAGNVLGKIVAVVGGFTFLAGSAIAISQSNAKRVLAYSTIANLGLIVCCAGIGNSIALGAAILLMIFHAVSKGLLFLCVGTIEHGIGSRDIEDMQGLMKKMPFTTVVTVIGAISMLLPPFGVLITKWLAIEASIESPIVMILIIVGSAFTVVFWTKWIGIMLTMSYKSQYKIEKLDFSVKSSLTLLLIGVLACSIGVGALFNTLVKPFIGAHPMQLEQHVEGYQGGIWLTKGGQFFGGFSSMYFFIIVFVLMITIPIFLKMAKPERIKLPYLCGENTNDIRGLEFVSPGDKVENVIVRNYYMSGFFGENNLTLWTNIVAGAIILIMFGVVI